MNASLTIKYNKLVEIIKEMQSAVVAFSGGVDSSTLLFVTNKILANKVIAITIRSPYHFSSEGKCAEDFAAKINAAHESILFTVFDDIRNNPENRCYLCKKKVFSSLKEIAGQRNIKYLIEGSNTDDTKVYRPGLKALQELGVRSPFLEAGFSKEDVRDLAREFKLDVWDRPSNSCILTRLPYGTSIEDDVLRNIEKGEEFLEGMGFSKVRLRTYNDLARIEVDDNQIAKITEPGIRSLIIGKLKELGYKHISIDLEGFRSGSFDE